MCKSFVAKEANLCRLCLLGITGLPQTICLEKMSSLNVNSRLFFFLSNSMMGTRQSKKEFFRGHHYLH